jgi:hypothetical protein
VVVRRSCDSDYDRIYAGENKGDDDADGEVLGPLIGLGQREGKPNVRCLASAVTFLNY